MNSKDFHGPANIGSDEMVNINQLAQIVIDLSGKKLTISHIKGPLGVRGRNSDNKLIYRKLKWKPKIPLKDGLEKTYKWISEQVDRTVRLIQYTHNQNYLKASILRDKGI